MVTAELAVALPAVVVVLVLALGGLAAGIDQVRCVDAARLAARSLARGDPPQQARALAAGAAPSGAGIALAAAADQVTVTVTSRRSVLGVGWQLSGSATAPRESG